MAPSKRPEDLTIYPEKIIYELLDRIVPLPASPVTIRILGVQTTATARTIHFKVVDWPELGPWQITISKTLNKAQAMQAVEDKVMLLAQSIHQWYGYEWSVNLD